MKKFFTKDNIFKIVLGLVCALTIIYFFIVFVNSQIHTKDTVTTELARKYSYSENISSKGFVVREETLLEYDGSKVVYYTVDDGDIVGVGSEVALVFANESDALNYNRINEINKQIDILESLNTSYENVRTDFAAVDKQIQLNLRKMIEAVNTGNLAQVSSYGDSVIYSVNQRQIITGGVSGYDEKIASLKAESNALLQEGGTYIDVITSDKSGYFVSSADGYENSVDYDTVTELDLNSHNPKPTKNKIGDNVIGKIVSGLNWYVVCKLDADEALTLTHSNMSIALSFQGTSCVDIPAALETLNQTSKQSDAVAVFKCNYMNTPLSHLRDETVLISVNAYEGIRISKEAIHDDYVEVTDEDGNTSKVKVQGVYVLHGGEVKFKEISIIYAGTDFVIVDDSPEEGKLQSSETVKLNDEIIVSGEDLYIGKDV